MKIAVVGSINIDMTVTAERIPKKGETLTGKELHYIPGGKGANQAVAMAKLGAEVEMFGCVGQDANGTLLLENLRRAGVKTGYIQAVSGEYTGIASIIVAENDNVIVVVAGANARVDRAYIDRVKDGLFEADFVVLQHEIPADTVEYVIRLCAEHKKKVLLNPAPARRISEELLEKVTYLTPNEHETEILFGSSTPLDALMRKYPEKLIVTLGSEGVAYGDQAGRIFRCPCRPSKVADTTGAGDTFNGAFCVKMAEGCQMQEAILFANAAAGLSVEKFGAQSGMPSREETEKALEEMRRRKG